MEAIDDISGAHFPECKTATNFVRGIFSIFGVSIWTTPIADGCMIPAMTNSGRYE
jgi:hypothetical protein